MGEREARVKYPKTEIPDRPNVLGARLETKDGVYVGKPTEPKNVAPINLIDRKGEKRE